MSIRAIRAIRIDQTKPEESDDPPRSKSTRIAESPPLDFRSVTSGPTARPTPQSCADCGSMIVRNGICYECPNRGSAIDCSRLAPMPINYIMTTALAEGA